MCKEGRKDIKERDYLRVLSPSGDLKLMHSILLVALITSNHLLTDTVSLL